MKLRIVRRLVWCGPLPCLALLLFATGCGSASQTTANVALVSDGLGLTKAEWEQHHIASSNIPNSPMRYSYDSRKYEVAFWSNEASASPNAKISEIRTSLRGGQSDDEYKAFARSLIPHDAQLQSTKSSDDEYNAFSEVYFSQSLASQYTALSFPTGVTDPWQGSPAGGIYVSYARGQDLLIRAGIGLPSNPADYPSTGPVINQLPQSVRTVTAVPSLPRPLPAVPTGIRSLPQPVPTHNLHP